MLIEGQSPGALKKAIKKFPTREPVGEAMSRLLSLLARLESDKELCLNAAGQLQAPPASQVGPLFIDALEQLSAAARVAWPDVPSPGEAISWIWPTRPQPPGGPDLQPLRLKLDELARLDRERPHQYLHGLPQEARLKQLKAERKGVEAQWKDLRRDYREAASAWRSQQQSLFLSDRLVALIEALARVSTRRGRSNSSLECRLYHAETLLPDCDWLLEVQSRRYGYSGGYESLVEKVCAARRGQPARAAQSHFG